MENKLYSIVTDYVNKTALNTKNNKKSWDYGYNKEYDLIVISKDGTIGEIYEINGLKVALPSTPKVVENRGNRWQPIDYPAELQKIKSIFDWNRRDNAFKLKYVDMIETEFERREQGFWFINNGSPTYMTGTHYMYLQWTKIDIGLPDFREANRIFFIFWEACRADERPFQNRERLKHRALKLQDLW